MLTRKDYCDYDTCVALKELGYNAPQRLLVDYFGVYDEPQYDERIHLYDAQKWLREDKKIEVVVLGEKEIGGPYYADIYTESGYAGYIHKPCEKYEEALSEGIKEAVEILKEK